MAKIQLKTAIPGPKSQALMAERREHVARGPFHVTPIFVKRAEGALIEDVDGLLAVDEQRSAAKRLSAPPGLRVTVPGGFFDGRVQPTFVERPAAPEIAAAPEVVAPPAPLTRARTACTSAASATTRSHARSCASSAAGSVAPRAQVFVPRWWW